MSKREQCMTCSKAVPACICQQITSIDSAIELIILQHPTEVKNAIGTARILALSLPYCQIFVGENFTEHNELNTILQDKSRPCYLLYPSDNSIPASELSTHALATHARFIIIDGTWRKAYKILQSSANVLALPAVRCDAAGESNYTIRKTSIAGGLSTVEAGYLLLSSLENNDAKYEPLLSAFNYMIDYQIKQMPAGVFEKNYAGNKKV